MNDSLTGISPAACCLDYRRIEVVEPEMAAILRGKTTSRRIRMMLDANQTMRLLVAGGVKTEDATLTSSLIEREVVRRILHASRHSG